MTGDDAIDPASIPAAIRERDQWVCWRERERDGKATKVPVTPGRGGFASATDPETWAAFETAHEYLQPGEAAGIGFVFTDDDPIVGVDLDDCRDPVTEEGTDMATEIIERLDSYTEVSPSGTGYHVLVAGELPDGRNRKGNVECYDSARFFTVTGDQVEGTPDDIARRQDALVGIHREFVQESTSEPAAEGSSNGPAGTTAPSGEVDLDDERLLEKARNASNGAKFQRLWSGTTTGYDSHSEADMALCCLLAFWTGGDRTQMDRLFRASGLLREKWDEVHYADGSTYGEKTIERAISTTSEFYDPEPDDEAGDSRSVVAGSGEDGDDAARSRAHLVEKNRLLTERVAELEAQLEQKDDRIATLTERLAARDDAESSETDGTGPEQSDEDAAGESSVWRRAGQLFRGE